MTQSLGNSDLYVTLVVRQTGVVVRRSLHVDDVHVFVQQLDDLVQLLVVAVHVNKDLKLGVTTFGLPGLDVDQVHMVLLQQEIQLGERNKTQHGWNCSLGLGSESLNVIKWWSVAQMKNK